MNNYNYLYIKISCGQCGNDKVDDDAIHLNKFVIKNYSCNHFNVVFMKSFDQIFRLKVVIVCKQCLKVKNEDMNIGKNLPNGVLITNGVINHRCCNYNIQFSAFITQNEINAGLNSINNNINNNNIIINNIMPNINNINNNIIINNEDYNDNNNDLETILRNEKKEFEKKNIIEFNLKNQILYFLDDKTKKSYKIYSKRELAIKDVLKDLEDQYPELNLRNRKFKVGNTDINPEYFISFYNLNENNIILMQ